MRVSSPVIVSSQSSCRVIQSANSDQPPSPSPRRNLTRDGTSPAPNPPFPRTIRAPTASYARLLHKTTTRQPSCSDASASSAKPDMSELAPATSARTKMTRRTALSHLSDDGSLHAPLIPDRSDSYDGMHGAAPAATVRGRVSELSGGGAWADEI